MLQAESLATMLIEVNTLSNHKTKVVMVIPVATVAMMVGENFN